MRSVTVEHGRLMTDRAYRGKMRPVIARVRNWRGNANGVRIVVLHDETCCSLQDYETTERMVLNVGSPG